MAKLRKKGIRHITTLNTACKTYHAFALEYPRRWQAGESESLVSAIDFRHSLAVGPLGYSDILKLELAFNLEDPHPG